MEQGQDSRGDPGEGQDVVTLEMMRRHNSGMRQLSGRGVGSVIRVEKFEAVPERGGRQAFPDGVFTTDPPVFNLLGACHSPVLLPLRGFTLHQDSRMRVWVVIRAVAPGSFNIPTEEVLYEQDGALFQQSVPIGYEGRVSVHAKVPHIDKGERPCLAQTELLNAAGSGK
jgi:hypothetical protein